MMNTSGSSLAAPMISAPPPTTGNEKPLYPDLKDELIRKKFIVRGATDLWCAIGFLITVLTTIVWGFVNLATRDDVYRPVPSTNGAGTGSNYAQTIVKYIAGFTAASCGVACLLCAVALALARYFPSGYIYCANALVALFFIALSAVVASQGVPGFLAVTGVYILVHGAWFLCVRKRIPFAGELLKHSITTVTRHYGTIVTSFGACFVLALYVVVFLLMLIPIMIDMGSAALAKSMDPIAARAIVAIFVFLFYWTIQVTLGVVHVTTCGTVATWYFLGTANMPPNPSLASLKRALTTSFGSICFGSLIVAILMTMRFMIRAFCRRGFLYCIALCLLKLLENLMRYFNVYAFCYIAIYGIDMVEASKRVWDLLCSSGVTALLNDSILTFVLGLTSFCNSLACGVLFAAITYHAANSELGPFAFVVAVVVFIMAYFICYAIHIIVLRVVYSGVVTIFVCFAEAPEALARSNPEFYKKMFEAYELSQECCCASKEKRAPLTAPRPEIACQMGVPLDGPAPLYAQPSTTTMGQMAGCGINGAVPNGVVPNYGYGAPPTMMAPPPGGGPAAYATPMQHYQQVSSSSTANRAPTASLHDLL